MQIKYAFFGKNIMKRVKFMKNRIDLEKFNVRTDLVIDNDLHENEIQKKKVNNSIEISTIEVNDQLSTLLHKKKGCYITIEFMDITNHEDQLEIEKCLEEEICNLLKRKKIQKEDECLILGLGNRQSTADSLGPATLDNVMVTRHLFTLQTNVKDGIRPVAALCPGVMANTGIETYDIVTSIIQKIQPKFLIVIDSLASSSIDRINKTIQLTDAGIHPGSGIGNNRKEISMDTIGIPVIAIGVPTVVESSIIVSDTIDYIFQHLSYIKKHYAENKLIVGRGNHKQYLEQIRTQNLSEYEKKEVSGILGELDSQEKKELILEVLNSIDYNMIVTPKEIDFLIDKLSATIAQAINKGLHAAVKD